MSRLLFPLALMAGVAVCGCASLDSSGGAPAVSAQCEHVDCEKMTRINQKARSLGVQVIWVNPPQKAPAGQDAGA